MKDYYTMIRSKDHQFDLRLDMVIYARQHGIRATVREFCTSRNTVRKWLRRYEKDARSGLQALSRAPKSCPHKTPWQTEQQIIRLRERTHFSPRRLKDEFDISASVGAIHRIIHAEGLTRKQRKKRHRKSRDLRAVKMAYDPLTHLQMDAKDLSDIPNYRRQMRVVGLPRYEFTVRDVCTGTTFISFASELTVYYAVLTVKRVLKHIEACGVKMEDVVITTDNGTEFSGNRMDHTETGFVHMIEALCQADHIFNPPASPNCNADVESFHNTIEDEFFDLETFGSLQDFKDKATKYQDFYNAGRINYSKGSKTPLDMLLERNLPLNKQRKPLISPRVFLLPPQVYGKMPRHRSPPIQVGHHVPALAEKRCSGSRALQRAAKQLLVLPIAAGFDIL